MSNSIQLDPQGPDWPLGSIIVVTPGTTVGIMSLVDPPPAANSPGVLVPGAGRASDEYTRRAQQIIFGGFKSNGGTGMVNNTGNIYICRKGAGGGSGNRTDTGSIIYVLQPGFYFYLASAPQNMNVFNPYRYSIDADNAGDACQVTLIIQ